MQSKRIIIIVIVVIGILIVIGALWFFGFLGQSDSGEGIEVPEFALTPENFAQEAARISLVQDLPKEAALLLQFYTFVNGERSIAYSYIIEKEQVREGSLEQADITININAKYFEQLTNRNLCSIIEKAKASDDMHIDTSLSMTALAWKYKSMSQYRSCLGF